MRAIVYHAYCQPNYVRMATISAESAKWQMPDVDTVLLTEIVVDEGFDRVIQVRPVPQALANFPPLLELPADYASIIYFDCDSYICAPFYDVFELIEGDRVDVALTNPRHRDSSGNTPPDPESAGVPAAYPKFRGAPIGFQNNARVRKFFSLWSRLFHENQQKYHATMLRPPLCFQRQPSMRVALYCSDLTAVALPPKYHIVSSQIVHGRIRSIDTPKNVSQRELAKIAKSINRRPDELRFVFGRGRQVRLLKDIQPKKQ